MCLMNIRSTKYENEIIIFKVNFATGGVFSGNSKSKFAVSDQYLYELELNAVLNPMPVENWLKLKT
jgi:hypothetical protein